jgi:hypothetical protein
MRTRPSHGAPEHTPGSRAGRVPRTAERTPFAAVLALQRPAGTAAVAGLLAQPSATDSAGVQAVLRQTGRPLPEPVRAEMQARLGADFSDVRVHADRAADESARAINAQAYTAGSHIVFQHGHYDPASRRGRYVLAHELTHVVQQRAGRVAGTDHGDGLRISHPADRFERAAESTADRVMRGTAPAPLPSDPHGPDAPRTGGPLAVQRNVGVELEAATWEVRSDGTRKLAKYTPIVHRPYFQLQAEWGGAEKWALELVTNPSGVTSEAEWRQMSRGMVRLARDLTGLGEKYHHFPADMLPGGERGYTIHTPTGPPRSFKPSLQVTVGVPLSKVPELLRNMKESADAVIDGGTRAETGVIRNQTAAFLGENRTPSDDLVGFVSLLDLYLRAGSKPQHKAFPKAVFDVLARTDFASMFALLPADERTEITTRLPAWVETVIGIAAVRTNDAPLLAQHFYDPHESWYYNKFHGHEHGASTRLTTSRDAWLRGMTADLDLLRYRSRLPDNATIDDYRAEVVNLAATVEIAPVADRSMYMESPGNFAPFVVPTSEDPDALELLKDLRTRLVDLHEGMGALGDRTDQINYAGGEQKRGVILEFRRLPEPRELATSLANVWTAISTALGAGHENVLTENQQKLRQQADDQRAAVTANFWTKHIRPKVLRLGVLLDPNTRRSRAPR